MDHLIPSLYGKYEVLKNYVVSQETPQADQSDRLELNHNNKIYKKFQENQVSDYDENHTKSSNRSRVIYPLSVSISATNIVYTNTDQFSIMKRL